jgi:tRNA-guanine family transglycosylase
MLFYGDIAQFAKVKNGKLDLKATFNNLGKRLATIHNLRFYHQLMAGMREALTRGEFQHFKNSFLVDYKNQG